MRQSSLRQKKILRAQEWSSDEEEDESTSSEDSGSSDPEEEDDHTEEEMHERGALRYSQSPRTTTGELAILVMGVTGSGKSTFINRLTEANVEIGHSLESCTTEVEGYTIKSKNGQKIYLIDTPGFDDTERSNVQLLQNIASALGTMYANEHMHFAGIVYLHRITDQRVAGSSLKSLRIFEQICGRENYPDTVLVTTMWNLLEANDKDSIGKERARTLVGKEEFFGAMVQGGAHVMRDEGDQASARNIIEHILRRKRRVVTALQREIVDDDKRLGETSVGKYLSGDLEQCRRRFEKERNELEEALEEATRDVDEDLKSIISDQKREYDERIRQAEMDQNNLSITFPELAKHRTEWCTRILEEAEKTRRELKDEQRRTRELEELLHRTEMDHLREINRLKQQKKDRLSPSEKEHAEQLKLKVQDAKARLEKQKSDRSVKEKKLNHIDRTQDFVMKLAKFIFPPVQKAGGIQQRTQSSSSLFPFAQGVRERLKQKPQGKRKKPKRKVHQPLRHGTEPSLPSDSITEYGTDYDHVVGSQTEYPESIPTRRANTYPMQYGHHHNQHPHFQTENSEQIHAAQVDTAINSYHYQSNSVSGVSNAQVEGYSSLPFGVSFSDLPRRYHSPSPSPYPQS